MKKEEIKSRGERLAPEEYEERVEPKSSKDAEILAMVRDGVFIPYDLDGEIYLVEPEEGFWEDYAKTMGAAFG